MSSAGSAEDAWAHQVVDGIPVGLGQVDHAGRVVRANQMFAAVLGMSGSALVGADLHLVAWPDWNEREPGVSLLDRVLAGSPIDGIFPVRRADGQTVELRVRAVPSCPEHSADGTDGGAAANGAVMVLAEVPVALAKQHSVGREAEAYRLLGDHLADVVVVTEGPVITWVSPSVQRILGYAPSALIGQAPHLLIPGQDDIGDRLTPDQPTAAVRRQLRHADGRLRWFDINAAGRFAADGTLIARYATARDVDDRVRLQARVDATESRFREALDASPDGFAIYHAERDPTGSVTGLRLLSINAAGAAGFAVDAPQLCGRELREFFPQAATNGLYRDLLAALQTGQPQRTRRRTDGPDWSGDLDGVQVRLDADTVMSTWRDVTDVVQTQQRLASAYEETATVRAILQTALDATSDGFVVFDLQRDATGTVTGMLVRHSNSAATALIDCDPDDVLGRDPRDVFPGFTETGLWDKVLAAVTEKRPRHHRVHLVDPAGVWTISIDNTIAPVGPDRVVLTFRDVTGDEKALRENQENRRVAEHAATHDALTGLPNRVLLHRRLTEALGDCRPGERVAVVFCDLDGFKQINDTYGHATGDQVLQETAARLRRLLRRDDTATRLSGDEFVLVLRNINENWVTEAFTARASEHLSAPLMVGATLLTPRASLGIVLADPHEEGAPCHDPGVLIAAADQAMYRAKAAARP